MGLFSLIVPCLALGQLSPQTSAQILYHIHHGDTKAGLGHYLKTIEEGDEHDYELLQQAGMNLLEQGASSNDLEIQMMCLLGAGVSLSPPLLPILEKGLQSKLIQSQLIALNFLSKLDDDEADRIFLQALSSPFLLTRLEACFQLSKKNHPAVLEHLQSLFVKVPDPIRPLFAQIVVNLDSNSANQMMRQLLSDGDLLTRCEAILAVAKAKRDDFLDQIRILASQAQVMQQECAAMALGTFKDRRSLETLRHLSTSRQKTVRLAAAYALYQLGEKSSLDVIEAEGDDLYAVALTALIPTKEYKQRLSRYAQEGSRDVKLNATIGLLSQRDPRALPYLKEILLSEKYDVGYIHSSSPGGSINFWKTVVSASQKQKTYPAVLAESARLREQILLMTVDFDDKAFLDLAETVFEENLKSLVPITLELLSNHRTPEAIALLKQQLNSPFEFIKTYCNLTLYRLGEDGPYEEYLVQWVDERKESMMIRFKEEKSQERQSKFNLAAEEESRLLIEVFESLAQAQSRAGIEALVHAIAYGHPHNRYALAGLLIRTTE